MSEFRLWGIGLIVVSVFKLAMTPIIGVRPDPVNLAITIAAFGLGCKLVLRSHFSARRERLPSELPHRSGKSPGTRCQCIEPARRSSK
jgi:hypothetical protein